MASSTRMEASEQDIATAVALMRNSAPRAPYGQEAATTSDSDSDSDSDNGDNGPLLLPLGWIEGATFQGHSLQRERRVADGGCLSRHMMSVRLRSGRCADLPAATVFRACLDHERERAEGAEGAGVGAGIGAGAGIGVDIVQQRAHRRLLHEAQVALHSNAHPLFAFACPRCGSSSSEGLFVGACASDDCGAKRSKRFLRLPAGALRLVARNAGMDLVERSSEEQGMYSHRLQTRDTWCARCCKCALPGAGGADCGCGARCAAACVDDVCAVQWDHPELRADLHASPDSVASVRSLHAVLNAAGGAPGGAGGSAQGGQGGAQTFMIPEWDSAFARAAVYAKSSVQSASMTHCV